MDYKVAFKKTYITVLLIQYIHKLPEWKKYILIKK